MIITNKTYSDMFNSVAREFVGRVELLEGSTLLQTFAYDDALVSFTVDKSGDNTKFFGYGVCQKATVKLRDKNRAINVNKGQGLQIAHGIGNDYLYTYPLMYVDEVTRDEKNNDLTIVAYDAIYKASSHKVSELRLPQQYTLEVFARSCAAVLGMPVSFENIGSDLKSVQYNATTANFNGDESIREALDDVAEMFGAIYYLNNDWELTFKQLNKSGQRVLQIGKNKYFDLKVKTAHTLDNLVSATNLGDNIEVNPDASGETQYLRENAFLTLRQDNDRLLENIFAAVKNTTLYQFECKHRGDFRLEIGDKISLVTKDDEVIETYVLNDSITYNGGLVGKSALEYKAPENEGSNNPTSLGDILKQTYAKVDKVEGKITLYASETDGRLSQLEQTADSITQTVSDLEGQVDMAVTAEDVQILINSMDIDSVTTKTGFTFNEAGLTVVKSDAPTSTTLSENGMLIRDVENTPVLRADQYGVDAKNLRATTYLIIGPTRFEFYNGKTSVFWIGGY